MKCAEFEDRLNRVLDCRQRPEWDGELSLHCADCAGCRELAAMYGVLFDGFYALATPEPPADFSIRVVDALHSQPSPARRVVLTTGVLATAAAVAVALVPVFEYFGNRPDRAAQTAERPVALASQNATAAFDWNDLDNLPIVGPVLISLKDADAATDPYAELAKGTGQGLANVVLYFPRIGNGPGALSVAPDVVNFSGEGAWPARVSESLRPVSESVGETLDLLLEILPQAESSRRS